MMKGTNLLILFLVFFLTGCYRGNTSGDGAYLLVDVADNHPKKELLLQDFMDVEYIALETSDEFLCQGMILDIGENLILARNNFTQDGNLYLFDRKGKGIRVINRRGQGGEEYTSAYKAVLDEKNGEFFINDMMKKTILVYDLTGQFKRSFLCEGDFGVDDLHNFDDKYLLCAVGMRVNEGEPGKSLLALVSKQDGSIAGRFEIPYKAKKETVFVDAENFFLYPYSPILPWEDRWILTEASSDTVFSVSSKKQMEPFLVRNPSIQLMEPEVFLFPKMLTDRYYFMERVKKQNGFDRTDWAYDRDEKTFYEYTLHNADYTDKQRINTTLWNHVPNGRIGYWQVIHAHELVEAYGQGRLKGKLKEIAARLEEESNPVILLAVDK